MPSNFAALLLPLLRPLGLDDWRMGVILLAGLGAKETLASTAVQFLRGGMVLSGEQACILGVVALLLPPCLGTLTTVRAELGAKEAGKLVVRHLLAAWTTGYILHGLLHLFSHIPR